MSESSNVVSFERSAAFIHRRAIKNRSSSPLDALELLRRALDASPDNAEYLMDAAEVYYEMGQYGPSIGLLTRVMRLSDAPPECYYGLGLNFWSMGSPRASQVAMACYLKLAEDGEYRDEVIDFLAQMHLAGDLTRHRNRRKRAAGRLLQRAASLARAGESARADWLLRQSLRHDPRQPIARALRALMLARQGDRRGALREAERALGEGAPIEAVCMAAQALLDAGYRHRALRAFERAAGRKSAHDAQPALIRLMCGLGLHDRAHAALRRVLHEAPYDREALHRMAASLVNLGRPGTMAAPYWRRILRVDPGDQLAAGYLQLLAEGALPGAVDYEYRAPESRCAEIAGKVAAWRQLPGDRLAVELFPHGAAALRWAI
ncbi:MAG: tetratricopeptide repeat protein, partial [Clostridiales bacterium]|nr:tetratricopeptide repeat protein [Clostridiales bacterium]